MSRFRVLFANHAQFEGRRTNLGDWAIFEQMVSVFNPYIEKDIIEVVVPSTEVDFTESNYPVKAFKRNGIMGFFNTVKWILKSDAVIIGGGEIVQDQSSMVYIPYQLFRPLIGKIFGKKLFGYAIGVGEKEEITKLGQIEARFVLNMFDVITVRDEKSYRVLTEVLRVNKPKVVLTADPALNLNSIKSSYEKGDYEKEKYFVISARSVFHRNHNILPFSMRKKLGLIPKEYVAKIDEFKSDLANLADSIVDDYNINVKFLNTYTGKSMSAGDDLFTNDIVSRMKNKDRVSIIDPKNTPSMIKDVLGKSMFVVTVPLHPLILSASENVPIFAMAYSSKSKSFMNQMNLSKYIYPLESYSDRLPFETIKSDISEVINNKDVYLETLKNVVDLNQEREKNNIRLFVEMLGVDK